MIEIFVVAELSVRVVPMVKSHADRHSGEQSFAVATKT